MYAKREKSQPVNKKPKESEEKEETEIRMLK